MHALPKIAKRTLVPSCRFTSPARKGLSRKPVFAGLALLLVLALCLPSVHAALGEEEQFVLNSFSFLIWGAL
ncbi:MAG: hypothetical protein OXC42_09200, partial [Gammaproteobacteria bacterium]|nr:hypothetical protein [Gammaproteobacteria bacterium]